MESGPLKFRVGTPWIIPILILPVCVCVRVRVRSRRFGHSTPRP